MINKSFYKSISSLGENTVNLYRKYEQALLYIMGQVVIFDISEEKFFNKIKTRFEPNLNVSRSRTSSPPTLDQLNNFAMHVKMINNTMVGMGVNYEMVVANSLLKLFFDQYG